MKDWLKTLAYYVTRPVVAFLFHAWVGGCQRIHLGVFDLVDATDASGRDDRVAKVKDAIGLVEEFDRTRYGWIEREIKLVVVSPHATQLDAVYHRFAKAVVINKDALDDADALTVAATLVHEAAHGVLDTRGIRYSLGHRQRIERLCLRSEIWFLSKIPGAEHMVEEKRRHWVA